MTVITNVRPYLQLDRLDRIIVDGQVKSFIQYAESVRIAPAGTAKQTSSVSITPKPRNTDARRRVLVAIAKYGPMTKQEIAEKAGVSTIAIITTLSRMCRDNMLYVVGQKNGKRGQRMNVYYTAPVDKSKGGVI